MSIYNPTFWKGVVERALSTAAQSAIAVLTTDVAGVLEVNWVETGSVVGLAALLSVLKSVATHASNGTASVGAVEAPAPKSPRHAAEET